MTVSSEVQPRLLVERKDQGPRPFWSVMIPAYQPSSDYLEITLRGVLEQDPGPAQMQIEVLDDCSPDGPPTELVRRIAGERVTVRVEKKNLGLAGIWNRCIEHAEGEWVHILHQDDLVEPGFYNALRSGVEQHPEVGAAFCRHGYCDEEGHWDRLSLLEMASPGVLKDFVEALVTEYRIQCAAIVVKRSTYEEVGGFSPELSHALDWEMWIRIADRFPIFYEPRPLAAWRVHGQATTSSQMRTGENIRDIAKAVELWRSRLQNVDPDRLAGIALRRFGEEALSSAKHFLGEQDFTACRSQLREGLACNPSLLNRARVLRVHLSAFLAALRLPRLSGES